MELQFTSGPMPQLDMKLGRISQFVGENAVDAKNHVASFQWRRGELVKPLSVRNFTGKAIDRKTQFSLTFPA
jgi:hypothetical protein